MTLSIPQQIELDDWLIASDENMFLFEELTDEKKMRKAFDWFKDIAISPVLRHAKKHLAFSSANRFFQLTEHSLAKKLSHQ